MHLKTNTTITVKDTKGQPVTGLAGLSAFKTAASGEIIATRGIPAGRAYSFLFAQLHAITNFHYLEEADGTIYRVVSVEEYDTPRGAHIEVQAERKAGT